MAHMDLNGQATQAIARYRASGFYQRLAPGCCRFEESCSHYAERALRQHSFPVALFLVVWRVLRCNPLTATRSDRRRTFAVLALAGLTAAMVSWTSAAVAAPVPRGDTATITGGCRALVGGRTFNQLDRDHPLQVYKGQPVEIQGQAPPNASARSDGVIISSIRLGDLVTKSDTDHFAGASFTQVVNVDNYLNYGSGLYRVDVRVRAAESFGCRGSFYAKLNGSKFGADVAIAIGGLGVIGVSLSARGGDPTTEDMAWAAEGILEKDSLMNLGLSGGYGCILLALIFLFSALGFGAMAVPPVPDSGKRIWVKGHPIGGFFAGLLAGIGAAVAGQQYGLFTFTIATAIVFPVVMAVLGGLRGWRGKAYKLRTS